MNILKVKKLHPDAHLPQQAHATDSGYDIIAVDDGALSEDGRYIQYFTGLAVAPAPGHHVLIHPRSSISKHDLVLCNSIGLCDNSYRGEIICRFKIIPPSFWDDDTDQLTCATTGKMLTGLSYIPKLYKRGDKIAQLVIEKTEYVTIEEVTELDETLRGNGGFGSTDQPKPATAKSA